MIEYSKFKVGKYYLYNITDCTIEVVDENDMDRALRRKDSAKLWVLNDGSSVIPEKGNLSEKELSEIQRFIKINFNYMYNAWGDFKLVRNIESITIKEKSEENEKQ